MCDDCARPSTLSRRTLLGGLAVGAMVGMTGTHRAVARERVPALQIGPVNVAPGLDIWPREVWAVDRPALAPPIPEDVRFLLVHHTASGNDYDENGALSVMRSAYDLHTRDRGWPDVCYNFFVDRFGRVFEARDGSLDGPVVADATGGSQGFAQLVCLLGDFTSVMPTDAAITSLVNVLAWLGARHAIDTTPGATTSFVSRGSNRWPAGAEVIAATISGHRDMSSTACPGDTFYPYVHDHLAAAVDMLRLSNAASQTTSTVTSLTTSTVTSVTTSTVASTAPSASPTTIAVLPASTVRSTTSTSITATTEAGSATTTTAAVPEHDSGRPGGFGVLPVALAGVAAVLAAGWYVRARPTPSLPDTSPRPPDRPDPPDDVAVRD